MKLKVMGSNPGYLLKSFLLYIKMSEISSMRNTYFCDFLRSCEKLKLNYKIMQSNVRYDRRGAFIKWSLFCSTPHLIELSYWTKLRTRILWIFIYEYLNKRKINSPVINMNDQLSDRQVFRYFCYCTILCFFQPPVPCLKYKWL